MTALLLKATVRCWGPGSVVMARRSRASVRHLILTALFVFLLLLPAVQAIAPVLLIPVPATTLTERITPAATESQPADVQNGAEVNAAPSGSCYWLSIAARVSLFVPRSSWSPGDRRDPLRRMPIAPRCGSRNGG